MAEKPVTLATRYLAEEWGKLARGETPPLDLTDGVVNAVMAVGYTRKMVDSMIVAYRRKAYQESNSGR